MENGYGFGYPNISDERSLIGVRATVMLFDNGSRQWVPSGFSPGLSDIQILRHHYNSNYRILGIRLDNREVSLNCEVNRNLVYNRATPIFHQWKTDGKISGLHFQSVPEAEDFALAIESTLEKLNNSEVDYRPSNIVEYAPPRPATIVHPRQISTATPAPVATAIATSPPTEARPTSPIAAASSVASTPVIRVDDTTTETAETNAQTASTTTEAADATGVAAVAASTTETSQKSNVVISPPSSVSKYQTSFRFVPKTSSTSSNTNGELSPPSSTSGAAAETNSSPPPPAAATPVAVSTWTPSNTEEAAKEPEQINQIETAPEIASEPATADVTSGTTATPIAPPSQEADPTSCGPPPPPAPPPPPPPPAPPAYAGGASGGLGSALQNAQLRKSPKPDEEPGSLARSASPSMSDLQSDMMSEMARKLKERQAKASLANTSSPKPETPQNLTPSQLEPIPFHERRMSFDRGQQERRGSFDRCRSPIPGISAINRPPAISSSKRMQSVTGQDAGPGTPGSGPQTGYATSAELEATKQELMTFVRNEVSKAKQEIIDAVRLLIVNLKQQ